MKKVILLAGYPATGKTYMSKKIKAVYEKAIYIAQDEVKEFLYDKVGFDNLEEKDELVEYGRSVFYEIVEKSVKRNDLILLDYPFSFKQINFLESLKSHSKCEFMTIRLTGDLDVLYNRRVERDLVPERNKGHILDCYHGYESYTRETYPLSREEFKSNCMNGKYNEFEFGGTIEVDVTDYSKIDYQEILGEIEEFVEGETD